MGGVSDVDFYVPDEHEAGVYANDVVAWHTRHELTIDFAVASEATATAPPRVVARVRIAPTLAFETVRKIHDALNAYEADWGEAR